MESGAVRLGGRSVPGGRGPRVEVDWGGGRGA